MAQHFTLQSQLQAVRNDAEGARNGSNIQDLAEAADDRVLGRPVPEVVLGPHVSLLGRQRSERVGHESY